MITLDVADLVVIASRYVGTEHLLLALLREGQGVAARVLAELGADHAQLRERVLGLLAGDLDAASALRDRERQLLAGKLRLERQLTAGPGGQAVNAENRELRRQLQRLRDLLRQDGIEPDDGSARTA